MCCHSFRHVGVFTVLVNKTHQQCLKYFQMTKKTTMMWWHSVRQVDFFILKKMLPVSEVKIILSLSVPASNDARSPVFTGRFLVLKSVV